MFADRGVNNITDDSKSNYISTHLLSVPATWGCCSLSQHALDGMSQVSNLLISKQKQNIIFKACFVC